MKKILSFISTANQLFFFIGIIAIGIVFIVSVGDFHPSKNRVEIVKTTSEDAQPKKTVYTKEFRHQTRDVFIFTIHSEVIDPNTKHDSGLRIVKKRGSDFSSGYRYNSDNTVNVLFVSEDSEGRMLFENDRLVTDIDFANLEKETEYNPLQKCHLFTVIDADSNEDGYLSEDDAKNLYASDYTGENTQLIFKDISTFKLIDNNKLLITEGHKHNKKFYTYNLETKELKLLNTHI